MKIYIAIHTLRPMDIWRKQNRNKCEILQN